MSDRIDAYLEVLEAIVDLAEKNPEVELNNAVFHAAAYMARKALNREIFGGSGPPEGAGQMKTQEYDRIVQEESLILDATELVYGLLDSRGISKAELARRLDRSKGYITQLLDGSRNMTLRTLADVAHAIGVQLEIRVKEVRIKPTRERKANGTDD